MKKPVHHPAEWFKYLQRAAPPPDWTPAEQAAFVAYWHERIANPSKGEPKK